MPETSFIVTWLNCACLVVQGLVCKKKNAIHVWATTQQNQQNSWAPSEDSDQPGHPPVLIRVFAVRMKKPWVLSYPLSPQLRLIRLGACPGWSESSLGTQSFCWFCHEVAHLLFKLNWKLHYYRSMFGFMRFASYLWDRIFNWHFTAFQDMYMTQLTFTLHKV